MRESHAEHSRQPDEIGMNLSLLRRRTQNTRSPSRARVAMANYVRDEFGFSHDVVINAITSDTKMNASLPTRAEFERNPEIGIDRFKIAFYDWVVPAYEIMNDPGKIDRWLPRAFEYIAESSSSRHDGDNCIVAADTLQGEHAYCPTAFMRNDIRNLIVDTDLAADVAYGGLDRFGEDALRRLKCAALYDVFCDDEVDELTQVLNHRLDQYRLK